MELADNKRKDANKLIMTKHTHHDHRHYSVKLKQEINNSLINEEGAKWKSTVVERNKNRLFNKHVKRFYCLLVLLAAPPTCTPLQ